MWANNLLYGFKNEWIIRGKLVESCHRNPILARHTNLFLNGQTASGNFLVTKIRPKIELSHESLMKASKWIKHLYKNLRLEYTLGDFRNISTIFIFLLAAPHYNFCNFYTKIV